MKTMRHIQPSTSNVQRLCRQQSRTLPVGRWTLNVSALILFACLGGGFAAVLPAGESSDSPTTTNALLNAVATDTAPDPKPVSRQRSFSESDLLELLTSTLQQDYVKDKGELELRLSNSWTPRNVPDEPLTLRILDLPPNGVTASFIVRFELRAGETSLGTSQIAAHARVWRDIWVARSVLKRGGLVADADIERQRRDVLTLRESLADFSAGDTTLELAEPLQSGSPLLARSVKVRPVIRRGQSADALVQDGTLSVTMKVEALEDGAPGQIIRARNAQSRRDIRGKVLNENTILISL
jgi:flagella basal body P-ring formation protein FlgA